MKLQVTDVGDVEVVSPFNNTIESVKTREWTITLSDIEVCDLLALMLRPTARLTGLPVYLFLAALLQKGVDDRIKQNLPILAAIITEKRRLDGFGVL